MPIVCNRGSGLRPPRRWPEECGSQNNVLDPTPTKNPLPPRTVDELGADRHLVPGIGAKHPRTKTLRSRKRNPHAFRQRPTRETMLVTTRGGSPGVTPPCGFVGGSVPVQISSARRRRRLLRSYQNHLRFPSLLLSILLLGEALFRYFLPSVFLFSSCPSSRTAPRSPLSSSPRRSLAP